MAITPRDNEAFYREVDEEVRRDQLRTSWQRYGKAAIAAVVLLFAAIGGFFWWQNQKQEAAGKQGAELSSAFEDIAARNKAAAGPKLDQLMKSDLPGYRAAAIMTKADLAVEGGNIPEATALFRRVAEDKDLDKAYRDLATVRMTTLEFDKLPPQQVIDRLGPFAVAHMKQGQPQRAAPIFAAIAKDQTVPESIRSRAVQMAGSLGVDAIQDAAGATGENKQ